METDEHTIPMSAQGLAALNVWVQRLMDERALVVQYVYACERIREAKPEELSEAVDEALELSRRVREVFR